MITAMQSGIESQMARLKASFPFPIGLRPDGGTAASGASSSATGLATRWVDGAFEMRWVPGATAGSFCEAGAGRAAGAADGMRWVAGFDGAAAGTRWDGGAAGTRWE